MTLPHPSESEKSCPVCEFGFAILTNGTKTCPCGGGVYLNMSGCLIKTGGMRPSESENEKVVRAWSESCFCHNRNDTCIGCRMKETLNAKDTTITELQAKLDRAVNTAVQYCDHEHQQEISDLKAKLDISMKGAVMLSNKLLDAEVRLDKAEGEVERLKLWRNEVKPGDVCYYCNEPIEEYAGNPGRWPLAFCHRDEQGKVKQHHVECLYKKLDLLAQRDIENLAIKQLVDKQAEDEGLWFVAKYASEAYLQEQLRLLHSAIENTPSSTAALKAKLEVGVKCAEALASEVTCSEDCKCLQRQALTLARQNGMLPDVKTS